MPALRDLRGVDCPVPRCCANAYATGRLLRARGTCRDHWYLETHCLDCGETTLTGSMRVDALANAALAADEQRDAIARAWVEACPPTHPCR